MRVLSIDPGSVSGIALFENDNLIEAKELEEQELLDFIEFEKPDVLVVEGYYNYPWVQNMVVHEYPVAELIGKIKFLAQRFNLRIVIQTAGLVKSVITKDVLKHFGIKNYKSKHITDAISHALYYLKYRKKD